MKTPIPDYFFRYWLASTVMGLVAAVFSAGFHHYDEHFHVLEFAALKLGLTSSESLPWEFGTKIRSWLLPALCYSTTHLAKAIGILDPLIWAMLPRLLGALLNSWVTWRLLLTLSHLKHVRLAAITLCFLWFLPYVHARTSIENWSGALFFLGLTFAPQKLAWTTFFWALGFQLRLHIAPMIAGAAVWYLVFNRPKILRILPQIIVAATVAFGFGALVDRWGYGTWTLPWLNYLVDQFSHQRASSWGVSPPWYYFSEPLLKAVPPISILLVGSALITWIRKPLSAWTWITLPFLVLHTLEPHKELRFLFPMLYATPFFLALAAESTEHLPVFRYFRSYPIRVLVIGVNSFLLLWVMLCPAEGRAQLFRKLQHADLTSPIFFLEEDPYSLFKMPLNFYRPPHLTTLPLESSQLKGLLSQKGEIHLVSIRFTLPEGFEACQWEFSVLPFFLSHFNINNWIQRTRVWTLYRCSRLHANI